MLLSFRETNVTEHVPKDGFYSPKEEWPAAYRFIWYLLPKLDRVCQQMKQTGDTSLKWDVFITPGIPVVTSTPAPNTKETGTQRRRP